MKPVEHAQLIASMGVQPTLAWLSPVSSPPLQAQRRVA
jgi:hypothetical protein